MKKTPTKKKYDKSLIMRGAWSMFKGQDILTFGECLKSVWATHKRHNILPLEEVAKLFYAKLLAHMTYSYDATKAQDIVGETFLRCAEKYHTFDPSKSSVFTWLVAIAKNIKIDNHRNATDRDVYSKSKYLSEYEQKDNPNGLELVGDCGTSFEKKDLTNLIKKAIKANLTEVEYEIFRLHSYEKKNYNEISELLNLTVTNIKVTQHRMKIKLAKVMKPYYELMVA